MQGTLHAMSVAAGHMQLQNAFQEVCNTALHLLRRQLRGQLPQDGQQGRAMQHRNQPCRGHSPRASQPATVPCSSMVGSHVLACLPMRVQAQASVFTCRHPQAVSKAPHPTLNDDCCHTASQSWHGQQRQGQPFACPASFEHATQGCPYSGYSIADLCCTVHYIAIVASRCCKSYVTCTCHVEERANLDMH